MSTGSLQLLSMGLLSLALGCGSDGSSGSDENGNGSGTDGSVELVDLGTPPDLSPQCTGKPMPMVGTQTRTISVGSSKRTYVLHVPPSYDASKFTQVVFAMHGFTNQALDFAKSICCASGQLGLFSGPEIVMAGLG